MAFKSTDPTFTVKIRTKLCYWAIIAGLTLFKRGASSERRRWARPRVGWRTWSWAWSPTPGSPRSRRSTASSRPGTTSRTLGKVGTGSYRNVFFPCGTGSGRTQKFVDLFWSVLLIRDVYTGSDLFPSRIRIFSIPVPGSTSKNFKYFNPKKWFLSSRKYDPGCSSRIRIQTFFPSRIPYPGSRGQSTGSRISVLDPQHWFWSGPLLGILLSRASGRCVVDTFVLCCGKLAICLCECCMSPGWLSTCVELVFLIAFYIKYRILSF